MSDRFVSSWRRSSQLLVAALLGFAAFLAGPGIARAGTLDQGNDAEVLSQAIGCGLNGCVSVAQTFTADLSGGLDRVDLHLERIGGEANPPLIVEIRNVENGSPGATVLDSATIPAASVPTTGSWVTVDLLPSVVPIADGTEYAIVAYTSGSDYFYAWNLGSTYAGGDGFTSTTQPPTTWSGASDFAFKTYVSPLHSLIVVKNGSGAVTSVPDGIDCGTTCSTSLAEGTDVTLTASPDPGFTFAGWSGACSGTGPCQVTMSGDQAVGATFTAAPGPGPGPASGDCDAARDSLAEAQAKLKKAKKRLKKAKRTGDQAAVKRAKKKLKKARAAVRSAQAAVDAAC